MLLNNKCVNNEIREEIIMTLKWKWGHNNPNLWDTAEAVLSTTALPKKQDKSQIIKLTLPLKEL